MALQVRNKPYSDRYFDSKDSKQQQLVDIIISELQDTSNIVNKTVWWNIDELIPIITLLNDSDIFNKYYIVSFSPVIDEMGTRYLLDFLKL